MIAANEAVKAREMPPQCRNFYIRILDFSNDHGKDVVPTLATIGGAETRSERTAAEALRWLRAKGWVEVQHRASQDEFGRWFGRSNITRPSIPSRWRDWLREHGHAGGKSSSTPRAPQNRGRALHPTASQGRSAPADVEGPEAIEGAPQTREEVLAFAREAKTPTPPSNAPLTVMGLDRLHPPATGPP